MGDEITHHEFTDEEFDLFQQRLARETKLLKTCFDDKAFDASSEVGGFELEICITDHSGHPQPENARFLELANNLDVVPELSRFNIELNTPPRPLQGNVLSLMESSLQQTWDECEKAADTLDLQLMMIGTLPSLRESDLTLENMSAMERYRALNEQVFRLRNGMPLHLEIQGRDHLHTIHEDVMLEAATTSFQVHLQMSQEQAVDYYNTSLLISAPMVAVCANSPFLFGQDLWDETRIPLFEQSVRVRGVTGESRRPERVWFGSGFLRESLFELFEENLRRFPVLLPEVRDRPDEEFFHLRLHNGTLWRWNRPLIGFGGNKTHLRLEHRVMPAGPTVVDAIANAAFFYGLMKALSSDYELLHSNDFEVVKADFYQAARYGLNADIHWRNGHQVGIRELVLEELLPAAEQGLSQLDIDKADIQHYLTIIRERVQSGQNGAVWQRAWLAKHGNASRDLAVAYYAQQSSGAPVHKWSISA